MKIAIWIVGGLAVAGGVSTYGPSVFTEAKSADERFADRLFVVRRGDLEITIKENGSLEAENSERLQPLYDGGSTITYLIEEGSLVEIGELLVEFDGTELESELSQEQTRLIQYEAELEAAEANLAIQQRENEAAIEKSDLTLEVSRLTLTRYNEGEYPNTLRRNQLSVEKTRSELKRAKEAFEQVPSLFDEGFLTTIQVEEERIRLKEAEINLENAEKDLELYEKLTRPMELKQRQAAVRDAEREFDTAKERAIIRQKEKEARVSQNTRHVESTTASIAELEKDLTHMKITAPRPGIVIYGDPKNHWMSDRIRLGNSIWQGMTVITLPDLTEMQVLINIHEADINLLELGQKCTITIDTYRGQIFAGEVTDIAKVASSSNWGDSTNKQFRVEVSMDELEAQLRAGITASVEVHIETIEDALHVPVHAVFKSGDAYICFTPTERGFGRVEVTIGKSNDHYVSIESGLAEGDRVLLFDPRDGDVAEDEDREKSSGFAAMASSGDDE